MSEFPPVLPSPAASPSPAMPTSLVYESPPPVTPDVEHLRLLAIFHWVVGGIQVLFGFFPIIHLVMGILIVSGRFPPSNGSPQDVAVIGWFFIGLAIAFMLIAWTFAGLTIYSGFQIKRRQGRILSIVVAGLNCMHFPFGTTLGVFTLIVLTRRSVEDLYRSTART